MKIYILVTNDKDGNPIVNMPTLFGRTTRAYASKARARVYARKFSCSVVEIDLEKGKIV